MAKVLMVDDDMLLLQVTCDFLESRGHSVVRCGDPTEAMSLAEASVPEIAIIDYEMPRLNGTQLLALLRQTESTRALPVIFLSGVDALRFAAQVPPDPRARFLHKPVDFGILDAAIAELLSPDGWSA